MSSHVTKAPLVDEALELDKHPKRDRGLGRSGRARWSKIGSYVGLILATFVAVEPILFMFVSSLKPDQQIFSDMGGIMAFLPFGDISFDNYVGVVERVPAIRFIANSIIVTVSIVVFGLLINSMIGFAISRMKWKGQRFILSFVIATLVLPFETFAVPMVYWVSKLPIISWVQDGFLLKEGMLKTYAVQILPFVANGLAIFLFAQHFSNIPKELDEAARVDGASWWTIYSRMAMPLSKPTIATVAIITMLPAWNSFPA
mgnify:CR=1 FL=1